MITFSHGRRQKSPAFEPAFASRKLGRIGVGELQEVEPLPPSTGIREANTQNNNGVTSLERRDKLIVIVEPRAFLRDCIVRYLADHCGALVGGCQSVEDVLEETDETAIDLVVLSALGKPWQMTLDAVTKLRDGGIASPVMVLVDACDPLFMQEALRRGLRGVVPATFTADIAVEAFRIVLAGGTFVPAEALLGYTKDRKQPGRSAHGQLTPREEQVLALLRLGKQNKQIAYELSLCEGTVKVHVHNIMKKLGVGNRMQVLAATN